MTLKDAVLAADNDYDALIAEFEARRGLEWQEAIPSIELAEYPISVVIPARNMAYSLGYVLDGLEENSKNVETEILVIDDASIDDTAKIAAEHRMKPTVISIPKRMGASVARNLGIIAARYPLLLFMDADMVLPNHVLKEFSIRLEIGAVGVGFRNNVNFEDSQTRDLLRELPNLERDHRVNWYAKPGYLLHAQKTIDAPVEGSPLRETDYFRELGNGEMFYDWSLPRVVVTALVGVATDIATEVGGFDPAFADGWGGEDTHFGAKLIATGLKVVPFTKCVGFHIDPPDAEEQWSRKLSVWKRNVDLYHQRLSEEMETNMSKEPLDEARSLLERCRIVQH